VATTPPNVWQTPRSSLNQSVAQPPRSERRKNTIIAWCLVAADFTVGWLGPLAQIPLIFAGAWLTWRHFAADRAARRRPPIRWPDRA